MKSSVLTSLSVRVVRPWHLHLPALVPPLNDVLESKESQPTEVVTWQTTRNEYPVRSYSHTTRRYEHGLHVSYAVRVWLQRVGPWPARQGS